MINKAQRALISLTDKSGIEQFATALASMGIEILSTGGTATKLRNAGIDVTDVSDFTNFPGETLSETGEKMESIIKATLLKYEPRLSDVKISFCS